MIGKRAKSLAAAAMFLSICNPAWAGEADETAAQSACDSWLRLLDKEQYRQSWDQSAPIFKAAVARDQWDKQLKSSRGLFGKVISRAIKSKQSATSLPGVPDGEYVVVQYDTSFEKKRSAIETTTAMKDKDGKWRAAGYYVK